jgi:16S rRNA A1518/A1519 N6-dimethyltransferase RsmA/KsgA/DIM1 with predicted DNA glycosylase/AP lyase activity
MEILAAITCPQKGLGQKFLTTKQSPLGLWKNQDDGSCGVIEIGPGSRFDRALFRGAKKVVAIELDFPQCSQFERNLGRLPQPPPLAQDFFKVDLLALNEKD